MNPLSFGEYISLSEETLYHVNNKIPLSETVFRMHSEGFYQTIREARMLFEKHSICFSEVDNWMFTHTDLGRFDIYDGCVVPLDCPFVEYDHLDEAEYKGKTVELNKPKRGGSKKFFVYVKNEKGNVVKVQWGDTTGLSVKINDPEARKAFAARHQCDTQKDKTSPAYWACNLPRYAKQLGLSGGGNFYW